IRAVGYVEKALLLVARESHTEARTESRRSLPFDEDLFDEFPIQLERLNAIIHAIADIDDAVVGNRDPMNRVELLRSRALVDARLRSRVIRSIAVSSPVPFIGAGIGVKHDHATMPIAICNEHLIGWCIDSDSRRLIDVLRIVAASGLAVLADLKEKLPRLGELQNI